jgi:hypothetical protein
MRKIIPLLAFVPLVASAQECDAVCQVYQRHSATQPSYSIPLQPIIPVPRDNGPWGKGYSIVTTTRPQRNLWDRDVTGSETVQRVVPNDALGQPIRGFDINSFYDQLYNR